MKLTAFTMIFPSNAGFPPIEASEGVITEEGPLDFSFMGKLVDTIEARSDGSAAATVVQVNSGTETEVSGEDGYGGGTATPDGWLRGSYHEEAHISSQSSSPSNLATLQHEESLERQQQQQNNKKKHNNMKKKSSKSERDKLKRRAMLLIQDGQDQGSCFSIADCIFHWRVST